jgi:hypothetical protein
MNEAMKPLYEINGRVFESYGEFLNALSYEMEYGNKDIEVHELEDHSITKENINIFGGRHALQQ